MFPANAWGLQDMHGNVWEWCLDDWHGSYEGAPVDGTAWLDGAEEKSKGGGEERKLLRGGSWGSIPGDCPRPAASTSSPSMPSTTSGFVWCASPRALPLTLNPLIPQHWLFLNPGCSVWGCWLLGEGAAGASSLS
jgi:hypothetical protein